jgi:hypothetical protein
MCLTKVSSKISHFMYVLVAKTFVPCFDQQHVSLFFWGSSDTLTIKNIEYLKKLILITQSLTNTVFV